MQAQPIIAHLKQIHNSYSIHASSKGYQQKLNAKTKRLWT